MTKLKIKLYNEGNVVIYRVLEQCESITAKKGTGALSLDYNGISIESNEYIDLYRTVICLRGCQKHRDYDVSIIIFDLEQEARDFVEQALIALDMFAKNGYFSQEASGVTINGSGVYEF